MPLPETPVPDAVTRFDKRMNSWLFGFAVGIFLGAVIGFAITHGMMSKKITALEQRVMSSEEYAALQMLRLGFTDIMAACAWESGRSNYSRDAMFRTCTIRYNIGEPRHEERRQPKK